MQIHKADRSFVDLDEIPEGLRARFRDYTGQILRNEELESHRGRWLVRIDFAGAEDDQTPDDIVQQLADAVIGFDEYPFDGIVWDVLGVKPSSYAGYLQVTRYLRTQVPAEVVARDELFVLV